MVARGAVFGWFAGLAAERGLDRRAGGQRIVAELAEAELTRREGAVT